MAIIKKQNLQAIITAGEDAEKGEPSWRKGNPLAQVVQPLWKTVWICRPNDVGPVKSSQVANW